MDRNILGAVAVGRSRGGGDDLPDHEIAASDIATTAPARSFVGIAGGGEPAVAARPGIDPFRAS
jgi:hypothetical protein